MYAINCQMNKLAARLNGLGSIVLRRTALIASICSLRRMSSSKCSRISRRMIRIRRKAGISASSPPPPAAGADADADERAIAVHELFDLVDDRLDHTFRKACIGAGTL